MTAMLTSGQSAPIFKGIDQDGHIVSLSDFINKKHVVLYFYPKDDTPGCTIEANQFTQFASAFSELDTVVIGVSKDTCESHQDFIKKYDLDLILLADTRGEICEQYGVWQEKEKNGTKTMGIVRSTFVINKTGAIEAAQYGVSADGHAAEILEAIRRL